MLGLEAAGAEDSPLPEPAAQVLQVARLVDVDAVGAAPDRHRGEIAGETRTGDDQGRAALLHERSDRFDAGRQPALVGGSQPQNHGGDIAGFARNLQGRHESGDAFRFETVRSEQGETGAVAHRSRRPAPYCGPIFGSRAPLA